MVGVNVMVAVRVRVGDWVAVAVIVEELWAGFEPHAVRPNANAIPTNTTKRK
jgi:hypothetical protein